VKRLLSLADTFLCVFFPAPWLGDKVLYRLPVERPEPYRQMVWLFSATIAYALLRPWFPDKLPQVEPAVWFRVPGLRGRCAEPGPEWYTCPPPARFG